MENHHVQSATTTTTPQHTQKLVTQTTTTFTQQQNSSYSTITIKIIFNDCAYNWNVNFMELNFKHAINHIVKVTSNSAITSFEYIDEDGDRITVKSEEEMRSLLKSYLTYFKNCLVNRKLAEPLSVFPKIQNKNKNFKGLKLSATNETSNDINSAPMSTNTSDDNNQATNNLVIKPNNNAEPLKFSTNHNLDELVSSQHINPSDLNNLGIVGQGHGGIVYKCLHNVLQKYMALKVRSIDASKESKKQIISELEILYQCNSPFVITYYGSFFHDSRIAMCTEFMDYGSLDLYKCVPQEVLARIAVAIVKGLIYLCNLKILHRDLKPSNVLLNSLGQVKLCDFGDGTQMIRSLTCSYVGTNAYMSPERIQGENYGVESDVWSLGLTLLETGLGRFPYENKTNNNPTSPTVKVKPIELLQCIMYEEPPKLPSERYSYAFNNFIFLCLQKNPINRPKPSGLMNHELIQRYDDGCINIIAAYLKQVNPNAITSQ